MTAFNDYWPNVVADFRVDADGNPTGGETRIFDPAALVDDDPLATIRWQNGILSLGRNGVLVEDLLEAALQRMQFFNDSKFRCRENSLAITHIQEAIMWLRERQRNRAKQGVQSSYETHSS